MRHEQLIDSINEFIARETEYALSAESAHADFAASFGYGDGEIDLRNLDDDLSDLVETARKTMTRDEVETLMRDSCSMELAGIWRVSNDIFSVSIGEIEVELPEEITVQLDQLSEIELAQVKRRADAYISGHHAYINLNGSRWVMVLDYELFAEALETAQVQRA